MKSLMIGMVAFAACFAKEGCVASQLGLRQLTSKEDVEAFFPLTTEAVEKRKEDALAGFAKAIKLLLNSDHTFDSSARIFDLAFGTMHYTTEMFLAISMVHQDPSVRESAAAASSELEKKVHETLLDTPEIYPMIAAIDQSQLTAEKRYFVDETLKSMESLGLSLDPEKRLEIKQLQSELVDLCEAFSTNIREDRPKIPVRRYELLGMSDSFIDSLTKDDEENYILTTDYPIYMPIMSDCKVSDTRRNMLRVFSNRGFPANQAILKSLAKKRHDLAQALGKETFAELQLSQEMVQNPERAQKFLDAVAARLTQKQKSEFTILKNDLPQDVHLDKNGQINPWDLSYALTSYKKRHFDIDEDAIQAYFPLEKTLRGLLDVYESFMGIHLEEVAGLQLWHPDARLIKVSEQGQLHGFIVLDLHPRDGKYTHACDLPVHPAFASTRRELAALSVVLCNFPKGKPSLMRLNDVRTFFHEFGHALHDMLGRTDLISTCGTNTKTDFVELPSQILEEWLWDKDVLQMCSSHFETKEPLPSEIIDRMLSSKNLFAGISMMRQIHLANFSLKMHQTPEPNLQALWTELEQTHRPIIAPLKGSHSYSSFGHLAGYGARYYGYLWSRVFALDVFSQIERDGLLNKEVGRRYIDSIIGRGGSLDPNHLLQTFLKREPSQEAFFERLGIDGAD